MTHKDAMDSAKRLGITDPVVHAIFCALHDENLSDIGCLSQNWCKRLAEKVAETLRRPIDVILCCPYCHAQHVDAVEDHRPRCASTRAGNSDDCDCGRWTNPPHRSHMCNVCGDIWRAADVATNGVLKVRTKGKNDT